MDSTLVGHGGRGRKGSVPLWSAVPLREVPAPLVVLGKTEERWQREATLYNKWSKVPLIRVTVYGSSLIGAI